MSATGHAAPGRDDRHADAAREADTARDPPGPNPRGGSARAALARAPSTRTAPAMPAGEATGSGARHVARLRDALNRVERARARADAERAIALRECARSRTVSRLVRDVHRIADREIAADQLGDALLDAIAGAAAATHAAILQADPLRGGAFVVTASRGIAPGRGLRLKAVPAFLCGPRRRAVEPPRGDDAAALSALVDGAAFLWAHDPKCGRALLLGRTDDAGFEADDREIAETALAVHGEALLRKQSEITLRAAKFAAEEASSVQARFLATLSHELRTPLNSVIGFSELLLEARSWMRRPEQQNEFLREILDSGRTLLSLINEILDFSSFGHASPQLQCDWTAVDRLLHDARLGLRDTVARSGVAVTIGAVAPGSELRVDYDRFRRILGNILGNALKFTPGGGSVAIGFEVTAGGSSCLRIADTGIGMHQEDVRRALEPFVQLDDGAARRYGGSGLGLPIARQLIEAHGGELVIDSRFGAGTTVSILLPENSARIRDGASEIPA